MVSGSIPPHYTNSPSSFSGTPHLTINRDITALDLDSSNAFEGPEKLLEVWFAPAEKALPDSASPQGLKAVGQESWKEMLDLVNCKVLSVVESRSVDAYLLSESSMFVFPHKLVLKTCGTTTLLYGLPRILEIAALEAGFPHAKADLPQGIPAAATPHRIFYSRKNFLYPDQQRGPHRSWREEVNYMDKMFTGGSAYMIGKMNGEHWYLYITGPGTMLTPPSTPDHERIETKTKSLSFPEEGEQVEEDDTGDETLEILMTDLEEENARQFYLEHASSIAQDNARRAHQVRKEAIQHLGVIEESNSSNDSIGGHTLVNGDKPAEDPAHFDVFGQTSSDHSDDEPLTLSEELTTEGHTLGSIVSNSSGLAELYPTSAYPDARIDAYVFGPCGYSANGVVPIPTPAADTTAGADEETNEKTDAEQPEPQSTHYWTVHVTPEPHCSYASFETNVPTTKTSSKPTTKPSDPPTATPEPRSTVDIIQRVTSIFKPGRFSVTLFEAKRDDSDAESLAASAREDRRMDRVQGYRRVDRIVHDLEGYELVFRYFEREDWIGGVGPRLGECY